MIRLVCLLACLALPCAAARAQSAVQPFTVAVTFSPKAAARMAQLRESVTVAAVFYGLPTPAARRQADNMGQIELGDERVTIPGQAGSATITGRSVAAGKLGLLQDRDVKVNINVFSARQRVADNILNCDLFEDSVRLAERGPVHINCKLITEGF